MSGSTFCDFASSFQFAFGWERLWTRKITVKRHSINTNIQSADQPVQLTSPDRERAVLVLFHLPLGSSLTTCSLSVCSPLVYVSCPHRYILIGTTHKWPVRPAPSPSFVHRLTHRFSSPFSSHWRETIWCKIPKYSYSLRNISSDSYFSGVVSIQLLRSLSLLFLPIRLAEILSLPSRSQAAEEERFPKSSKWYLLAASSGILFVLVIFIIFTMPVHHHSVTQSQITLTSSLDQEKFRYVIGLMLLSLFSNVSTSQSALIVVIWLWCVLNTPTNKRMIMCGEKISEIMYSNQ